MTGDDSASALERIAEAVLYEGYVLWPYRRSAGKTQKRWTFGVVYPRGFCEATHSGDGWRIQAQCLVVGSEPVMEAELRCLQLIERRVARVLPDGVLEYVDELQAGSERILAWEEATERRWTMPVRIEAPAGEEREVVDGGVIVRSWAELGGWADFQLEPLSSEVWRVTATLNNTSAWTGSDRNAAQRHGFLSAHLVLRVRDGELVSATDPPPDLASAAAECQNVGVWPVLVGTDGQRDTMLASPIILSDYPRD